MRSPLDARWVFIPARCLSVVAVVVAVACGEARRAVTCSGEEPPRLSPIDERDPPQALGGAQPLGGSASGRVDPSRATRLSPAEREQLYDKVIEGAELLERQSAQLRRLTQLLRPCVVHIDARKAAAKNRGGKESEDEAGSGVIAAVGARTVVVTNRHVVNRAELDNIVIRLDDGRELRPQRLWTDPATDIAVLAMEGEDLTPARFAEQDNVQIGDTVLAIGSPFGLSHSVTLGIVSAKGRRDLELGNEGVRFQDFIQTDAAINPGNSGGPLVNLRGEVIGLNTAIASNSGGSEGIGFAIPVSMVLFVARQLVDTGNVSRAYLGVTLDRGFTQRAAERLGMVRAVGARVSGVTKGSPADAAGIQPDDVILEFDGHPIDDDDHLVSLVSVTPTSRTVTLGVFRNRGRISLDMPVASREQFEPQ
ncbi:MAG: PDZ domain-containing protein [Planctomycetota bacterium]|nr:MAG: PDZ domain-containing protein [Planctomycetota bacterium]